MGKYLDTTGLSHLMGLIKSRLMPSGGSSGQVLTKSSGSDYDAAWSDAPTVSVDSSLSSSSTNPVQNKVIKSALDGKADSSSLATVATSGSYSDLSNKPTILGADDVPLLKGATQLSSGADLNGIVSTGTYYAESTDAANISNTPYSGAFKLYVERTLSTATYLKQRFEIYNGVNQWVRVSTDGGSTWDDWYREAPHATQNATANRFLATPNGSAGVPNYRAIVNADLPTVDAAHGGTGQTTLSDAQEALANSLSTESVALTDSEQFIIREVGSTTKWHRRSLSALWNYIKGKADDAYLALSGGTITGVIERKSSSIDFTKSDNGTSTYWNPVMLRVADKNDRVGMYLQLYAPSDGYVYTSIDARNFGTGSAVTNQLRLRVDNDGTRKVEVSEAAPWREAIGAAASSHYHGYLYYGGTSDSLNRMYISTANNLIIQERSSSSGSWEIVGYSAISSAIPSASGQKEANKVFATPNGSSGYPSMRALVANDLPAIPSSKVTGLGSVVSDEDANVSVNSAAGTNISQVTLAAGTWLVSYSAMFATNATGRRFITLSTSSTYATNTATRGASCPAVNGGATTLSRCAVVTHSSSTTYYLNAYHSAGSAINVSGSIQAVRIA